METETLPQGSAPVTDFQKVIEQSKANLAEAQTASAPKRGRGRPPGSGKNAENSQAQPTENARPVEAVILKENEIEPLSLEIVKAPFDLVGWRTGVEVTPTDDEAKAPSKYLSKLIECYLPDLDAKDPKKFNAIALVITLALLGLKKLRLFTAQKKTKKTENQNPAVDEKNADPAPTPKVQDRPLPAQSFPAGNLFNRGPQ